jgi:hypothetical protein
MALIKTDKKETNINHKDMEVQGLPYFGRK